MKEDQVISRRPRASHARTSTSGDRRPHVTDYQDKKLRDIIARSELHDLRPRGTQVLTHGVQYIRSASLEVKVVPAKNPHRELTGRHVAPAQHLVVVDLRIGGTHIGD